MKKLIVLLIATLLGLELMAQEDVTKFLGIPVTGSKTAMIQKLKAKGYTYNASKDCLEGEFNGMDVRIYVVTNNNKVYRIMVEDKYGFDDVEIISHYNVLLRQFEQNKHYIPYSNDNKPIDKDEDVGYKMAISNNRYEAAFIQTGVIDSVQKNKEIDEIFHSRNRDFDIYQMSQEERQAEMNNCYEQWKSKYENKLVWFMIQSDIFGYKINLFYDNVYNQAHGEDL